MAGNRNPQPVVQPMPVIGDLTNANEIERILRELMRQIDGLNRRVADQDRQIDEVSKRIAALEAAK